MSPQANTATRTVLSLLFLASASAAPWITPAHALAVIASVTGIIGGLLALSNLFHVPAKVTAVMAKVVSVLDDVAADIPADTLASAKKIAGAALLMLTLGAVCMPTSACTAQQRAQAIADIPAGAACVLAIVGDVSVAPDIAGTIAKCGVTAQDIYTLVAEILDNKPDAAAPDGAVAASNPAYEAHLRAWLEAASHARAATVQ
jgi:hypothetical protein